MRKFRLVPPTYKISKEVIQYLFMFIMLVFIPYLFAYTEFKNVLSYQINSKDYEYIYHLGADYFLSGKLMGSVIFVVFCLGKMVDYYRSYFRESKSIYLMKRISNKTELSSSITLLPIVSIIVGLLLVMLLANMFIVYYNNTLAGLTI